MQGDGVLFQIGVSSGPESTSCSALVVNPFGNPSDRGWQRHRRSTCRSTPARTWT